MLKSRNTKLIELLRVGSQNSSCIKSKNSILNKLELCIGNPSLFLLRILLMFSYPLTINNVKIFFFFFFFFFFSSYYFRNNETFFTSFIFFERFLIYI